MAPVLSGQFRRTMQLIWNLGLGLTTMTGQRSLAEIYANEFLSEVTKGGAGSAGFGLIVPAPAKIAGFFCSLEQVIEGIFES